MLYRTRSLLKRDNCGKLEFQKLCSEQRQYAVGFFSEKHLFQFSTYFLYMLELLLKEHIRFSKKMAPAMQTVEIGGCGHRSRYLAHAKRALYRLS